MNSKPGPSFHHPATPARAAALARGLLAALLATAALAPPAVLAQDEAEATGRTIPNSKCQRCHADPEKKADDGGSILIEQEAFDASKHRRVDCVECHKDALEIRHPRNNLGPVPAIVCSDCHEEEVAPLLTSAHAKKAQPDADAANCGKCHGDVHTMPRRPGLEAPLSPVNQMQTCGQCHGDMMEGYLSSSHAHARLVKGLTTSPGCTDCHGEHDILPMDNPASRTSFENSPKMCGDCHDIILDQWQKESAHGTLWKEGDRDAPTCSSCHEAHSIQDPNSLASRQHFPDECGSCHEDVLRTYRYSFHGKMTDLGYQASAICSDCHTPHRNLPASDPRSSTHPDNLAETCGQCHANVTAGYLSFGPHNDPSDPDDNIYVYWIYVFMVALLIGVFGFFGLHDLLWLQRALVGKLRGEYPSGHGGPGQYVKRFTGVQIGVHISIVVSFLILAATGLPLKFPNTPWAAPLADVFGGPEAAAWWHRIGAVITFGYFGFHVLNMLFDMLVRREKGYLWGWRSMVPQWQDVKDLLGNVRYFLYLGPRPKFDRWAYWEKFDYLAVFWGVAIIGFSGLMLWFPGFFASFLPGWTLNAAYVVHSDEALLATGFIFLFHFFHTHLRPESFPMDPVIFTGRMPLERFKEERPKEYARLVAENRLESLLVGPPDKATVVRGYVFGFLAVAIGIMLAVFIIWALLTGQMH